ncbi:nucleoside triphosphate pyrophosphohydrolase family protein [Bacillus cereus]|nr:nucleoside triphosphate pyrophosphohydrolase family protein [Bacillus cereus]
MTKKTDELKIGFDWEPKKPKEKEIKEGMLIEYNCLGVIVYGVVDKIEGDRIHCYWSNDEGDTTPWILLNGILNAWDIVVHEPKEQNLSAAQELSVQQEAANFGYQSVQGIVASHDLKNNPCSYVPPFKKKTHYTEEEFLQYGEEKYLRGREDEHRENPHGLITQSTLDSAKGKSYNEGYEDAYRVITKDLFLFSDFDSSVQRTWKKQDFKDAVSNAALGLTGEAGEVADLIKKAIYHGRGFSLKDNPKAIAKYDVKDELSDVLFYVSAMAQEFGFTLEDIAKHNREKLEKRFPEGFSTEASAHKKDKHERKLPIKAKVVGDREGNPTGMCHGLNYGRIVTVTGEIFGNCYKADGLTIFKDDLKEVTD